MRELGRFIILLREFDEDIYLFEDVILFQKFLVVVKCIRILCGFNDNINLYVNLLLVFKLGYFLKKCVKIKIFMVLIEGSEDMRKNVDVFYIFCENEWSDFILSSVL